MDAIVESVKPLRREIPRSEQKEKPPSSLLALDNLIQSCQSLRHLPPSLEPLLSLQQDLQHTRTILDEANKKRYKLLNKVSRTMETMFPESLDHLISSDVFRDPASVRALDQAMYEYFVRTGENGIAKSISEV